MYKQVCLCLISNIAQYWLVVVTSNVCLRLNWGAQEMIWVVKPPDAPLTLYPVDRISTFAGKSFGANTKISGMVKRFPQYWAGWGMMQTWGQVVPARTRHVFNISQENLTYTCLHSGHSNRPYEKGKDRLMIDTIHIFHLTDVENQLQ